MPQARKSPGKGRIFSNQAYTSIIIFIKFRFTYIKSLEVMSALGLSFGFGLGIPCLCITAICFLRIFRSLYYPGQISKPPIVIQSNHLSIPPSAPMELHNSFIYATSNTLNPASSHNEPPDFSSVVSADPQTQNGPYVIRMNI